VKRSTFQARPDYYVLFAVVDRSSASLDAVWLVPSMALSDKNPAKDKIRFQANVRPSGEGQWDRYSLSQTELPSRLLAILNELGPGPS
jgi:hypothetical protein